MDSAMIVSHTEKAVAFFTDILAEASIQHPAVSASCGEARRLLLARDFDLVIVNAPLPDESGEALSRHIASSGAAQVILVVKSEIYEPMCAVCEDDGVLVVAKPVNKAIFWSALKLAASARSRIRHIEDENRKLRQKIEDIRTIDRAKCLLIARLSLSEQDAHRYIEKQAMDQRTGKRAIAEQIIKSYDG